MKFGIIQDLKKLFYNNGEMKVICNFFIIIFSCFIYFYTAYALFGTPCTIKAFIGIPCPGCGTTRAFVRLLKGDFINAFHYHPLFPITIIVILSVIYYFIMGKTFSNIKLLIAFTIFIYIGVYVLRLVLYFPWIEPMTINNKALLIKFLKKI